MVSRCLPAPDVDDALPAELTYEWIDNDHIVTWADSLPCTPWTGVGPSDFGMSAAIRDWTGKSASPGPSVDVIESGSTNGDAALPRDEVVVLSASTGARRIIARGSFDGFVMDPNRRTLALTRRVQVQPIARDSLLNVSRLARYTHSLLLVSLRPSSRAVEVTSSPQMVVQTVQWSPDGGQIAFIERDWRQDDATACATTIRPDGSRAAHWCGAIYNEREAIERSHEFTDLSYTSRGSLGWIADDALAIRMRTNGAWGALVDSSRVEPIASLAPAPESLIAGHRAAIAVSDRHLVSVSPKAVRVLDDSTQGLEHAMRVDAIGLHWTNQRGAFTLVRSEEGSVSRLAMVDIARQAVTTIAPCQADCLVAASPSVNGSVTAVLKSTDSAGLEFTVVETRHHVIRRLSTLPVSHQRVFVRRRVLRYRSNTGDSLFAVAILPPAYRVGQRYPVLVSVYPDVRQSYAVDDSEPLFAFTPAFDAKRYALNGYVILYPSAPWTADAGPKGELLSQLAGTVLPAVDAAVDAGLVDSSRMALIGHSAGGYAVLGLLTQTTRFRAAIAMAGETDLAAAYGMLVPGYRYDARSHFNIEMMRIHEVGQYHLGMAPWQSASVYTGASPFFLADRITTPVLLVQGDRDFVPVQQGEALFSALYRLGRRVQLARYWGEGHTIAGYYNQVDLEHRITVWLRQYLGS